jgi:hypothetical protein
MAKIVRRKCGIPATLARAGIPAREIGDRVGQRQISTTLDVYTHVLISPEEVSEEAYRAALVVSPWCLD